MEEGTGSSCEPWPLGSLFDEPLLAQVRARPAPQARNLFNAARFKLEQVLARLPRGANP